MSTSNLIGSALLSIPAVVDLPSATNDVLGGVMVQANSGILVDSNGNISVDTTEFLSTSQAASTYATQLSLSNYLTISDATTTYATQTALNNYALLSGVNFSGPVEVPTVANGDSSNNAASTQFVAEAISGSSGYTLPIATTSTLGGIKVDSGLEVDGSGNVSTVNKLTNTKTYYLQMVNVVGGTVEFLIDSYTVPSDARYVIFYGDTNSFNAGSPPNNSTWTLTFPIPTGDGHTFTYSVGNLQYGNLATSDGSTIYPTNEGGSSFRQYSAGASTWVYFESVNAWLPGGY
jgi:hypothetical protein